MIDWHTTHTRLACPRCGFAQWIAEDAPNRHTWHCPFKSCIEHFARQSGNSNPGGMFP